MEIIQVETPEHIKSVRALFEEYIAWTEDLLDLDLSTVPTFESLDDEFASLPGIFSPPDGALLMAWDGAEAIGSIALKKIDDQTCELKRMYVKPSARGKNIGWDLANRLMEIARECGYKKMILDSHESMTKAHAIYRALGFKTVSAPDDFPEFLRPIVVFMECDLS